MARIRSIKPEFWTSEQVIECSTNARLLFIGLWNFCDDLGRHALKPKQIKAEIFPADDFSTDDVRRMVDELSSNDLITIYSVENEEYLQVNGWRHQRIDRAQPAKHPGPNESDSSNVRRPFVPDRRGREGIGEEGKGDEGRAPVGGAPPAANHQEFDFREQGRAANPKLTEEQLEAAWRKFQVHKNFKQPNRLFQWRKWCQGELTERTNGGPPPPKETFAERQHRLAEEMRTEGVA